MIAPSRPVNEKIQDLSGLWYGLKSAATGATRMAITFLPVSITGPVSHKDS